MADSKELAKAARTTLSQALNALQSDENAPESLAQVSERIAATMGILHRIEKSGAGAAEQVDAALDNVRGALDSLQLQLDQHPSVEPAMEAVAGSLSKIFALAKSLKSQPSAPTVAKAPAGPSQPPAAQPPAAQPPAAQPPAAQAPAAQAPAAQAPAAQAPAAQAPAAKQQAPAPAAKQEAQAPAAQAPAAKAGAAKGKAADHGAAAAAAPATPGKAGSGGPRRYDVELGAHSGSNFYKGLSGNDVIDHGGVFVATYQVPPVGAAVSLRILMPGDLELEAEGVVQWTRDTRSGESEPGFGARVTRISSDGRQLVYRYVRNREPIFYDDM